jgi:hypothetical protein
VIFYRNVGMPKAPKLAAGETLVPAGLAEYDAKKVPDTPTRGVRAKVCVADWNGDGKLDLLVGDFTNQKPQPKKLTPDEEKKIAEAKKRFDAVRAEFGQLTQKLFGPKRVTDKAELRKLTEQVKTLQQEMMALYKVVPQEYETHGWVWYFERATVQARRKR